MPTYEVTTNEGTFNVDTDKTYNDPSELRSMVVSKLHQGGGMSFEEAQKIQPDFTNKANQLEPLPDQVIKQSNSSPVRQGISDIMPYASMAAGSVLGGVPGGIAGYVAGTNLKGLANTINNKLTGNSSVMDNYSSLSDIALNTTKQGIEGANIEMGGRLIGAGISGAVNKIAAPFASKMTPEALQRQELGKQYGVPLTPSEITQSRSQGLVESVLDKLWGSSDTLQKRQIEQFKTLDAVFQDMKKANAPSDEIDQLGLFLRNKAEKIIAAGSKGQETLLNNLRDATLSKYPNPKTSEELGQGIQSAFGAKQAPAYNQASGAYEALKGMAPTEKVPLDNMQATAQQLYDQIKTLPSSMRGQYGNEISLYKQLTKEPNDEFLKEIAGLPPKLQEQAIAKYKETTTGYQPTLEGLQNLRKDLTATIMQESQSSTGQKFSSMESTPAGGRAKLLRNALDADMAQFAESSGGDFKQALDDANAGYRSYKETFRNPVMQKMINANPEKVLDMVVKPNQTTDFKKLRDAIGNDNIKSVSDAMIQKLIGNEEVFNPDKLQGRLNKYGEATLREVIGDKELSTLQKLANQGSDIANLNTSDPTIQVLAKTSPEKVFDAILKRGNLKNIASVDAGNMSRFNKIEPLLGSSGVEKIKERLASELFTPNQQGLFQPSLFKNMVSGYGDKTLHTFFRPDEIKEMKDLMELANISRTAEKIAGNPSGTGQTLMSYDQGKLVLGNPIKQGLKLVLSPKILAKIYLSPGGTKYLTEGFKTPLNSPQSKELFDRLMATGIGEINESNTPQNQVSNAILQSKGTQ